jgi:hypothetical protein
MPLKVMPAVGESWRITDAGSDQFTFPVCFLLKFAGSQGGWQHCFAIHPLQHFAVFFSVLHSLQVREHLCSCSIFAFFYLFVVFGAVQSYCLHMTQMHLEGHDDSYACEGLGRPVWCLCSRFKLSTNAVIKHVPTRNSLSMWKGLCRKDVIKIGRAMFVEHDYATFLS